MKQNIEEQKCKTKHPCRWKIAGLVFLLIIAGSLFLVFTKPGRSIIIKIAGDYVGNRVQREPDVFDYDISDDGVGKDGEVDIKPAQEQEKKTEDYVTNYLLIGIEKIYNARNTDVLIIVSINTYDKSIKLTSLLRDTLVELPGYSQNKINSAYVKGGAEYLIRVVEDNFKVKLDGYASVDFEAFEAIVDQLQGIEIELTKEESEYLNTTNYISNDEYRTTVPGKQVLNGNQVLGYCRIRKVATLGGENFDYGRTVRQRRVLEEIFNRYRKQGIFNLIRIMDQCIPFISTNVSTETMKKELTNILDNGITTMNMNRIPADGMYRSEEQLGNVRDVLIPDLEQNIRYLHDFIYNKSHDNGNSD